MMEPCNIPHIYTPPGLYSTDKLLAILKVLGAPADLLAEAQADAFHEYKSQSATPIIDLVRRCELCGLSEIAQLARNGAFDATQQEADEWAASEEGQATLSDGS